MSLIEKIDQDCSQALKKGDKNAVSTIRMLKAELINRKIELGKGLTEDQINEVIRKEVKKREEAIQDFKKGGRDDLVQMEEDQLRVLRDYLPPELSPAEITEVVEKKKEELNITQRDEFGRLMGEVMKELKGKADGAKVRELVTKSMEGL